MVFGKFWAVFGLGVRARALCSGTKKDDVQTPWCFRSNRVLVPSFRVCHFVNCIVRRQEEKMWELTKSCSDQSLSPGTEPVPGDGAQTLFRAPTKSSVQTSAHAREPGIGT